MDSNPEAKVKEESRVYTTRDTCRLCEGKDLTRVWSFGDTPLANSYIRSEDMDKAEAYAPLDVYYCGDCNLAQLLDVVNPSLLFDHYLYVSSTSPSFVKHFEGYAASLIERFKLNKESLVIDVGSNDGVLLKPLQEAGVKVLGIDPAKNVAAEANAAGIETKAEYFVPEVAEKLVSEYGKAKVISANNVFAHTDLINEFVDATKILMADDGVFVFEVQYLGDLISKNLFDIVYHEHVNYYSVHPLVRFFEKQGMEVFDVEKLEVHGGSIRVFVQLKDGGHEKAERLQVILEEENAAGLTTIKPFQDFADRIESNKVKLREMIDEIKKDGKTIVGFGAPAKATTLMHAFGLTADDIDYIVDDAPLKQGLLMPGTHVPIVPSDKLYEENMALAQNATGKADYCIILAWNFAEPIMENHKRFIQNGGRFIIPVPEPKII